MNKDNFRDVTYLNVLYLILIQHAETKDAPCAFSFERELGRMIIFFIMCGNF